MSKPASDSPVEPKLFDLVKRYAAQIRKRGVDLTKPLLRDTPVVEFCVNFFLQFFDNELGREITGLDDQAKSDATRLRVGLKNKRDRGATRKVIMSFEELCDIWPDILGFAYGGSVGEFRLFHVTYVPRLLRRIEAWATERGYDSLAIRVSAVARDYEKAVQNL